MHIKTKSVKSKYTVFVACRGVADFLQAAMWYHLRIMKLSRPSRFLATLITLFSLLFTQLAVAAYACPGLDVAGVLMAQAMPDTDMPGCRNMDQEQPGLCAAHCDANHQSLDTPGAPLVQPFFPAELSVVLLEGAAQYSVGAGPVAVRMIRTPAPPLIIRNCCFRI